MTLYELEAELAENYRIKLDRSALGRIEKGAQRLSDYELVAIAHVLSVDIGELLTGTGAILFEEFVQQRPRIEEVT
jgi:transcriptional regulator with XRE-family HTH domain